MLSPLLYAALALAVPGEQPRVGMEVECFPESPKLGDVVFIKVTAVNRGEAAAPLPTSYSPLLSSLRLELHSASSPYGYTWRGPGAGMVGGVSLAPLAPGDHRVVAYETIEMPPISDIRHDFWSGIVREPGLWLLLTMSHPKIEAFRSTKVLRKIQPRTPEEIEAVVHLFDDGPPANEDDWATPQPSHFGLASYPAHMATREKLVELESKLSEGTLRDILHLTRLMQDVYDEPDEGKQIEAVDKVLHFLDTLPEIEREILAMRVFDWWLGLPDNSWPNNPGYFRLADGVLKRMPKKVFGFDDYPAYRLRDAKGDVPAFLDYVERHVGEDYRVVPEPKAEPEEAEIFGGSASDDRFGGNPFSEN